MLLQNPAPDGYGKRGEIYGARQPEKIRRVETNNSQSAGEDLLVFAAPLRRSVQVKGRNTYEPEIPADDADYRSTFQTSPSRIAVKLK